MARPNGPQVEEADPPQTPLFASRPLRLPVEDGRFPEAQLPADTVQQVVRDKRLLDVHPRLNLASFVTTWMEPKCQQLMVEAFPVNAIDVIQYPATTQIQESCIHMLADLFHAEEPCGSATVGSTEAIMLAGLAMKKRWAEPLKAAGEDPRLRQPNFVCSSASHVCWEKFFTYFEVEARYVNITEGCLVATPEKIAAACDENTIGVAAVLGTTYTGHIEDVQGLDAALGRLNEEKGWDLGIHVDGASGAFVLPFLYPDVAWDFRLPRVVSINSSGHKFGLVYPSVGWLLFRSRKYLPQSLVFHENYLGQDQSEMTLNFSKGASQIIAQYYQFLRLGRAGYTQVMRACREVATYLADSLEAQGHWDILSSRHPDPGVPLVAFSLKKHKRESGYDEWDLMDKLKERGWVVPAFTLAPDAQALRVLRILCRQDFPRHLVGAAFLQGAALRLLRLLQGCQIVAAALLKDIGACLEWLDAHFIITNKQVDELKQGPQGGGLPRQLAQGQAQLGKEHVHIGPKHHTVQRRGHALKVPKHGVRLCLSSKAAVFGSRRGSVLRRPRVLRRPAGL